MSRILVALLCVVATTAQAAPVSESPEGQQNVDVLNARDRNAEATPKPNYWKVIDNNAAVDVPPTPAAGECVWGDKDASAADDFALKCAGTLNLQRVVLDAGTTDAGTAPLKFTAGSLLSSVEPGAMEYFNNGFWLTNWYVRRTVVQGQEVLVADVTVANTTTETTVYTQPHGANYLVVGKMEDIQLVGTVSSISGAGSNTLTARVKYAGATIGTFNLAETARSAVGWNLHIMTTVRAIGAGTTSVQVHCDMDLNGTATDPVVNTLATGLDSTTAQSTTVTFQWSDANVGNTISVVQGRALSIDDN